MATQNEEIKIKITMSGEEAAKQMDNLADKSKNTKKAIDDTTESFKPLKVQLKEAVEKAQKMSQWFGENSNMAVKAQKRVAELKEEISDLNDRIDALHPEAKFKAIAQVASGIAGGFAAAQGAMALFGSESENVQKALLKVQAASAIAQGINELKGLGDAWKNFKVVALDALSSIKTAVLANPLMAFATAALAVGAAIGAWMTAEDDLQKEIKESREEEERRFIASQSNYDRQIALAKSLGENTRQLENEQLEDRIKNAKEKLRLDKLEIDSAIEKAAAILGISRDELMKKRGALDAYKQLFTKQNDEILNAENALKVKRNNDRREDLEAEKKKNEEALKNYKGHLSDKQKAEEEARKKREADEKMWAENKRLSDEYDAEQDALRVQTSVDLRKNAEEEALAWSAKVAAAQQELRDEELAKQKTAVEEFAQFLASDAMKAVNGAMGVIDSGLSTVKTFFDAAEQYQLNKAQGNAAKQEEIKKKFFDRNKKLQIAQTAMDTFASAQAAYRSTVGIPFVGPFLAPVAAGVAIAQGIAQIAKIRATQYQSTSTPSAGGTGGGMPSFNPTETTQPPPNFGKTKLDSEGIESGKSEPIKVYVTETDISNKQKRVRSMEERVTIR